MHDRNPDFIRQKDLPKYVPATATTIWRWQKSGLFPRSVQLGPNTRGVPMADYLAWRESRSVEGR